MATRAARAVRSSSSTGKWQAIWCVPPSTTASGGSCAAQISCAFQHRVRNRQPDGGLIGLGTSPVSRIRSRWALSRRAGSGTGTADISATVYGWRGVA